jgi:hypothetical protein
VRRLLTGLTIGGAVLALALLAAWALKDDEDVFGGGWR